MGRGFGSRRWMFVCVPFMTVQVVASPRVIFQLQGTYSTSVNKILEERRRRIALFWFITQQVVVIYYWPFGITFRSHLQVSRSQKKSLLPHCGVNIGKSVGFLLDSWILKLVPIICSETSVINYHYSLRRNPQERSSHLHRGGSLKSRKIEEEDLSLPCCRRVRV